MTPVELPFRAVAELSVSAHQADGEVVLQLSGTADLRVTEQLSEVLLTIHEVASIRQVRRVTVDMTDLEFMNSSCVKSFVSWLAGIHGRNESIPYKVRFLSNPEILWQRNSLRAIRCMVPDIVTVETKLAG